MIRISIKEKHQINKIMGSIIIKYIIIRSIEWEINIIIKSTECNYREELKCKYRGGGAKTQLWRRRIDRELSRKTETEVLRRKNWVNAIIEKRNWNRIIEKEDRTCHYRADRSEMPLSRRRTETEVSRRTDTELSRRKSWNSKVVSLECSTY